MSHKITKSLDHEIGKTIASQNFLNTMDEFWFALKPNVIINSFDFVTVDNLFGSRTIGILKELQAVATTDHEYYNYLSNYNHKILLTKKQLKREKKKRKRKKEMNYFLRSDGKKLYWQKLQ